MDVVVNRMARRGARDFGRSERIRTSDPLLPKQVRYQTALRSDRGRGVKPSAMHLQEGGAGCHALPLPLSNHLSQRLIRGVVPISIRERLSRTGVFCDTDGVPSRRTM
jgi:hypothetical protein